MARRLVPVEAGLPDVRPRASGTVKAHDLTFNVTARKGPWNAFRLVGVGTDTVRAWFVCHRDVDAGEALDKILRVSGSPYEPDSGSRMNDDKTHAEGVLVINRYDWGYYDRRFWDEHGEEMEQSGDDVVGNANSVGLVDYAQAQSHVLEWKERRPSERHPSGAGIWLYIPHGEYMFGRFGFDDARAAAHSFLFFSASTVFTQTAFAGPESQQQPLRQYETPEDRFRRKLREGDDFSGLEMLHEVSAPLPGGPSRCGPPESEWLGPYDRSNYVLQARDIESLRILRRPLAPEVVEQMQRRGVDMDAFERRRTAALDFADPLRETAHALLNELALSYLERFVLPRLSGPGVTAAAAADALFPDRAGPVTGAAKLDSLLHSQFIQPQAQLPIPGFDSGAVGARIRHFLASRGAAAAAAAAGGAGVDDDVSAEAGRPAGTEFDDACIAGICLVVAFLISEVLELSSSCAAGCHHLRIVPVDIRMSVFYDNAMRRLLCYSRVFWTGAE